MTYTLILLRHGQSTWNKSNQFTGWMDVPLTEPMTEDDLPLIYAVLDLISTPDAVKELDRQLGLQETVLRTKVIRREPAKAAKTAARIAAKAAAKAKA